MQRAFPARDIAIEAKAKGVALEMFDRQTGEWKALQPEGGAVRFKMMGASGELLRVKGGKLP